MGRKHATDLAREAGHRAGFWKGRLACVHAMTKPIRQSELMGDGGSQGARAASPGRAPKVGE